jgi:hypothetical protein
MTDNSAPADGGILTIEQAVASLDKKETEAPQAEDSQEEAPTAEQADEPETPEAATTADEDGSEADEPGDAEEAETEGEQGNLTLDAPNWWNKEQKELWKTLDPKVQAAVYAQEENRERVLQKTKQKVADEAKVSAENNEKLQKRLQVLDTILPHAISTYQNKWDNVDWVRAAQEMEPADYQRARAQYEQESAQVSQLLRQQDEANKERLASFVREEGEKLKTLVPDLVDEKLGPQRQRDLRSFLTDQGFGDQQINSISAHEASIAYDAMRWRQAQAKAAAIPKKPAVPAQPATRPSAAVPQRNPTNARITELSKKKNLSIDEATELMTLKGGS